MAVEPVLSRLVPKPDIVVSGRRRMPRLFLSYNHEDDGDDGLVDQLIRDLTDEIRRSVGWSRSDIFYRDVDVEAGREWPLELVTALRECHVFVPLLSPQYFDSEYCGKEWGLFRRRIDEHRRRNATGPMEMIVPVLWEAESKHFVIPEIARSLQHQTYGGVGLRRLVRHPGQDEKVRYRAALVSNAERLIDAAGDRTIDVATDDWGDLDDAVNVFESWRNGTRLARAPEERDDTARAGVPSRRVSFVVTAATAQNIAAVRGCAGRYDSKPVDWCPHEVDKPLVRAAVSVAQKKELTAFPLNIDDSLSRVIDEAKKEHELVILLVDPWTLLLSDYRKLVEWYDGRQYLHTAALVVWDADPDTMVSRDDLLNTVSRVFQVSKISNKPTYSDRAGTAKKFKRELRHVIEYIQVGFSKNPDVRVRRAEPLNPAQLDVPKQPPRLNVSSES